MSELEKTKNLLLEYFGDRIRKNILLDAKYSNALKKDGGHVIVKVEVATEETSGDCQITFKIINK